MQLLFCTFIGLAIAIIFGIRDIERADWYILTISGLLAIGLYSSTYGIVLNEAKKHLRIILSAITIGVFLKAFFIGSILSLLFQDPFFFLLGIMVAQIDPLSVSVLMHGNRLSTKAKTILASWSSFDDPITIILCLYIPAFLTQLTGTLWYSPADIAKTGLSGYIIGLGSNIGFAICIFILWTILRNYTSISLKLRSALTYVLLSSSLLIAGYNLWLLSTALLGLFLRPPIETLIQRTITWALRIATVFLGLLLINGINLTYGIALSLAAFAAQIIVGLLLTYGLGEKDRLHIAFAQQNGITAIILALLFEPLYPGTVSIIAPAILTINSIHALSNRIVDRYLLKANI